MPIAQGLVKNTCTKALKDVNQSWAASDNLTIRKMSSQPSHFSLEGHLIAKHTLSEETKKLLHTLSLEKKLAKLTAIKIKI